MLASAIPAKFQIPWGASAGGAYIRPIPQASQIGVQAGAASLTDGFPPLCFTPPGAGGSWPWGQDFNGIFNQVTLWNQWQSAGGPVTYDSGFSSTIGGYPAGAILSATSFSGFWQSTVDNNVTDPDTGGAGWIPIFPTGATRLVTASGAFTIASTDETIGFNRIVTPATSTATVPASAVNKIFKFADLAGNFNRWPVSIAAPAGQTFAGQSIVTFNVNRQVGEIQYFGSNLWSVRY